MGCSVFWDVKAVLIVWGPGDGIFNVDGESWFKQRSWDAQVRVELRFLEKP